MNVCLPNTVKVVTDLKVAYEGLESDVKANAKVEDGLVVVDRGTCI